MSEASHVARFFDCAEDYRDFSIGILRKRYRKKSKAFNIRHATEYRACMHVKPI